MSKNYISQTGIFDYYEDKNYVLSFFPEKRSYNIQKNVMTEAAISSNLFRDIYIALGDKLSENSWVVRIYYKPFIQLLWYGAALMILGGLWHGAALNFLIWGLLHGTYLAAHKMMQKAFPKISQSFFFKTKFGRIISILITQYFVFLAWIPFRVQDTENIFYFMSKFVLIDFQVLPLIEFILLHKISTGILILFFVFHFISFYRGDLVEKIAKYDLKIWIVCLTSISLLIVFFYSGNPEDFIYFRF